MTQALQQQDVYINRAKVREFQFQIDNLFGCFGKPFSCDVEIRHADQLTVLPIEIEVLRSFLPCVHLILHFPTLQCADWHFSEKFKSLCFGCSENNYIVYCFSKFCVFVISLYKFLCIFSLNNMHIRYITINICSLKCTEESGHNTHVCPIHRQQSSPSSHRIPWHWETTSHEP